MARTLKSIPMSLVPFHYHKPSLSECAQSATTSDVMAINNGLTQRKMDHLRILLSVSGVDHFAVHGSNASSRNKPGRYCWPIRSAKLECVFWAVLSYTVTSHEQSLHHLRWTTKRPAATAYTSLPTFEAAHILIQDLSHSFLFYVLLLPFQIVFAPKSTFPFIGSEIYVRVANFSRSLSTLGQPMAPSSAGRASIPPAGTLVTKNASSHCHVPN